LFDMSAIVVHAFDLLVYHVLQSVSWLVVWHDRKHFGAVVGLDNHFFGDPRVVDVHIRGMRKALGDDATDPRVIGTVRGVGYKLLLEPRPS
jgi:hypothetical protein